MRLGDAPERALRRDVLRRRTTCARGDRRASTRASAATSRRGGSTRSALHLASLGAPVVGDKLYGPDERALRARRRRRAHRRRLGAPRAPAARAARRAPGSSPTPSPASRSSLEAPLPADIADFWAALDASGASRSKAVTSRAGPCRGRAGRAATRMSALRFALVSPRPSARRRGASSRSRSSCRARCR